VAVQYLRRSYIEKFAHAAFEFTFNRKKNLAVTVLNEKFYIIVQV
jgi:hypothetical protein